MNDWIKTMTQAIIVFLILLILILLVLKPWCGECCVCGRTPSNLNVIGTCMDCCPCTGANSDACHGTGWNMNDSACR
jgi:hypothetical protein